jgi:hypothetical protein
MTTDMSDMPNMPDDRWPSAHHEQLLAALTELDDQKVPPAEAAELADALARLVAWHAPSPTPEHTQALLQRLEPLLPAAPEPVVGRLALVGWLWLLTLRQARLIPRALWLGSALALLCLMLFAIHSPFQNGSRAMLLLAPLIAATGAAFVYSREVDPALELTLATATSARLVLLCRVTLILGFDVLLTLSGSALVAASHGQSAVSLLTLWLGPELLLSSGALCLSLLAGPLVAAASAIAVWGAQLIAIGVGPSLTFALTITWLTTPLALGVACIFLIVALMCAPYQRRLA